MIEKSGRRWQALGRCLASLKLTVALLLLLALLVLGGTAYQAENGLTAAQRDVFAAWFFPLFGFIPLPGLLLVGLFLFVNLLAAATFRLRYRWRHAGLILIHYGLLLLIAGGFIMSLGNAECFLTLREGESADVLTLADGRAGARLPFALKLVDFEKVMHPGTDIPKSFTSRVEVSAGDGNSRVAVIAMNQPLRTGGYTFYQSSYAEEEDGVESSTFSVVRNSGRWLPYAASALLFLGLSWHFLAMIAGGRKSATAARGQKP